MEEHKENPTCDKQAFKEIGMFYRGKYERFNII